MQKAVSRCKLSTVIWDITGHIHFDCSALSRFEFKFTPYLSFDAANFPFHCTISINWMKYLLQQQSLYT
ncbi:hypothetical protein T09_14826 [Trichinella sp. T9]|nr:hypothetical protein T09_14826 [Trichinella sp. T9]